MIDKGIVVVKLSLSHVYLRARSFCLLLRLALPRQVFGVIDPRHNLTHSHSVALANFQHQKFTRNTGFDHGSSHRFECARDEHTLRHGHGLGHGDVSFRQLYADRAIAFSHLSWCDALADPTFLKAHSNDASHCQNENTEAQFF